MGPVVTIKGGDYVFESDYKNRPEIRRSFNCLTEKTFEFSLEQWYQDGYWHENYIPYSLLKNGAVVSNVSVNLMDFQLSGKKKRYVQIGTVMTDSEFRERGLGRYLMEKVLEEWIERCDQIYLFSNDSALAFYPKFGFEKADQYQCSRKVYRKGSSISYRKLEMSSKEDRRLFEKAVSQSKPSARLALLNPLSIVGYYCGSVMRDHILYLDALETAVIAGVKGATIYLHDLFSPHGISAERVLEALYTRNTRKVVLGFTPIDKRLYDENLLQEKDNTLFVLSGKENPFKTHRLMFPVLSRA
ncbi:MAG TPA: GNAT family N-acetyltransferase [Clostridia bacterium]|nr:GNAT family N-acetyltransferase [Clostridia bacterium]